MAVLDFPASPITGDKYPVTAVPGQPQYTYDGVKWTTVGAQISNAAPATALPLMDAATAVVGTATKYAREDHVHPRIPAAPMDALGWSGMQVNGSFEVTQEKVLGTTITAYAAYICDGWQLVFAGTMVPNAATANNMTIPGFTSYVYVNNTAAQPTLGSTDYASLHTAIEGYRISRLAWGTANAQPLTIGFWSANGPSGVYSVAVRNATATRSYVASYTQVTAGALQYNTITIPGCVDGTWPADNSKAMMLTFSLAAGSANIAPQANTWASSNYIGVPGQINGVSAQFGAIRIAGVVVLPGIAAPTAAQSPLIMRPYDQELLTCKRYYEKQAGTIAVGQCTSSVAAAIVFAHQEKRSTPSLGIVGAPSTFNLSGPDGGGKSVTSFATLIAASPTGSQAVVNVASGLTQGNATTLWANPSSFLAFDARL